MLQDDPPPMFDRPKPEDVATARVISWTPFNFGVAVDYTDGVRRCMYVVGDAGAAAAEVRRLLGQPEERVVMSNGGMF